MSSRDTTPFIQKRDAVLLVVLLFVVIVILTVYDLYQKSKFDESQVTQEAPPMVTLDVDLTVFERLKMLSQ